MAICPFTPKPTAGFSYTSLLKLFWQKPSLASVIPHPVHLSGPVILDLAAVFQIVDHTFLLETPYPRDSMFFFFFFSHPPWPFLFVLHHGIFLSPLNLADSGLVHFYMSILSDNAHPPFPALTSAESFRPAYSALCWIQLPSVQTSISLWALYFFPSFPLQGLLIYLHYLSQLMRTVSLVKSETCSPFLLQNW